MPVLRADFRVADRYERAIAAVCDRLRNLLPAIRGQRRVRAGRDFVTRTVDGRDVKQRWRDRSFVSNFDPALETTKRTKGTKGAANRARGRTTRTLRPMPA